MDDVVVDTNVLVHAENESVDEFESSDAFFRALLASDAHWCLDEGFHPVEARNRSRIYSEYLERELPSSLGLQVLATLAASSRVDLIPGPPRAIRDKIRQWVWDPTDRVFAAVAHGTQSGVLVTHDYTNFPDQCCRNLETIGVSVLTAAEGCDEL